MKEEGGLVLIEMEIISEKILDLLDDKGELNFIEVKRILNEPGELIGESLRWLIQTGFITENVITRKYVIIDQQIKTAWPQKENYDGIRPADSNTIAY